MIMAGEDWDLRDWDAGDWDGDAHEWPEVPAPTESDNVESGSDSGNVSFDGRVVAARMGAVFAGLVAAGVTYWYWGGHADPCAGTAGWWFIAVVISPLAFIALAGVCVAVVPSDSERWVWLFIMAVAALVYVPSLALTALVGSGSPAC